MAKFFCSLIIALHLMMIQSFAFPQNENNRKEFTPHVRIDHKKKLGKSDLFERIFHFYFGMSNLNACPQVNFNKQFCAENMPISSLEIKKGKHVNHSKIKMPWYRTRGYKIFCGVIIVGIITGLVFAAKNSNNVNLHGDFNTVVVDLKNGHFIK